MSCTSSCSEGVSLIPQGSTTMVSSMVSESCNSFVYKDFLQLRRLPKEILVEPFKLLGILEIVQSTSDRILRDVGACQIYWKEQSFRKEFEGFENYSGSVIGGLLIALDRAKTFYPDEYARFHQSGNLLRVLSDFVVGLVHLGMDLQGLGERLEKVGPALDLQLKALLQKGRAIEIERWREKADFIAAVRIPVSRAPSRSPPPPPIWRTCLTPLSYCLKIGVCLLRHPPHTIRAEEDLGQGILEDRSDDDTSVTDSSCSLEEDKESETDIFIDYFQAYKNNKLKALLDLNLRYARAPLVQPIPEILQCVRVLEGAVSEITEDLSTLPDLIASAPAGNEEDFIQKTMEELVREMSEEMEDPYIYPYWNIDEVEAVVLKIQQHFKDILEEVDSFSRLLYMETKVLTKVWKQCLPLCAMEEEGNSSSRSRVSAELEIFGWDMKESYL